MKEYALKLPGVVYSGSGALKKIPEIIRSCGAKKLAVFSDKGIEKAGLLEQPLEQIRAAGAAYELLDDLPAEPSYMQVQALVDRCRTSGAELIVGVGGGSVMDTAKLAGMLMTERYTVRDLLDAPELGRKSLPSLMIPTTAGTGSEATPNAIVAVPEKQLKVGIVNSAMIADYVILDPVMIKDLPRKIAAAVGVDALAHAIECFTGNKANPFSDTFALDAFDKIFNHIERACSDPEDMEAKENMLLGSFYAGVAIACSGTTAVHALSYPLGGKYHIPHGVSNAIMLMPVMRFNEPAIRERLAAAFDRAVHEKTDCRTAEEKSAWLLRRMERILKNVEIPTSLSAYKVPREDLEELVSSAMEVTRLLVNNVRPVTADDARRIYRQVM